MTSPLDWITFCVIETVARVLAARAVAAISTGDLTPGPCPAPGADTLSSHVMTLALAAVTRAFALGAPGSFGTGIHAIESSEARRAATPSRYGVTTRQTLRQTHFI